MATLGALVSAAFSNYRHDQHPGSGWYFKAFAGLVEKVFCLPIRGSEAMIDPVILSNAAYDAGLVAEPMSTVGDALERDCFSRNRNRD